VPHNTTQITGIHRGAFKNRGALYTPWGCSIRCVKEDQSAVSNTVHYLADGTCTFKFYIKKQEFLIPCIMVFKALVDCTDKEIAEHLNPGNDVCYV
jgi:DNA-directed RNA polymerase I subunit RPA2